MVIFPLSTLSAKQMLIRSLHNSSAKAVLKIIKQPEKLKFIFRTVDYYADVQQIK